MKYICNKRNLSDKFTNVLFCVFQKLIKEDLNKYKSNKIFEYISTNYNISLNDIYNVITKIKFSKSKCNSLNYIYLDSNIKIKDNVYLDTIIDLIDYGTISIKGLHIFDKNIDYIKSNINSLRQIYILKGGKL